MQSTPDRTTAYAQDVTSGKIIAGRLVRLACQRHLRDLETGHERGLKWSPDLAARAMNFFLFLRLADGQFAGEPFTLQPFQQFIVGSVFGWLGPDGFRRFRTAYCELAKGNGKTPSSAAIGLYGLTADGEAGAEIYPAATTREQAGILFRDAKRLVESSPHLSKRLQVQEHNIANPATGSFLRPVSSEHRGLDGKRPHMALIDEIHEHPTAMVVDKLRAGTKARRQALIFETTNAGHDRTSVCWTHHEYSMKVLEGILQDDSWFAYVAALDCCEKCRAEGRFQPTDNCPECDQWDDERVWLKANPGLDTILPAKYLREQVHEAKGMPSKESIVKRLNFCLWTEAAVHAIPMDAWDACRTEIDHEALKGQECYAGLDIGATSDFTAFALLFPHDDAEEIEVPADWSDPKGDKKTITRRTFTLLPFFWLPEQSKQRDPHLRAVIEGWRRSGLIRTTPGNVVDYDQVVEEIVALREDYPFTEIAFDRGFQGSQTGTHLMKHFGEAVIAFPQGIISMNSPFRELVELVILKRLQHDGNPVLRWMASNCAAESRGGLIKPSKEKSSEKIDIITAATMAMGRAMLRAGNVAWTIEVY